MFSQLQFNHLEVKQAKQKGWIEADVADWLIPEASAPGWLYGLVKDHADPSDWSERSRIPLLRPVESASCTTFENASHFVDIHSNALVKNIRLIWRTLQKWSESLKDES